MGQATARPAGGGLRTEMLLRSAWLQRPRWDDHVAQAEALKAFRPDAEIWQESPAGWHGSLVTGGGRAPFTGTSLEKLLAKLFKAVLADAVAGVEADYPSRHVWVSAAGRWYATLTGPEAGWRRGRATPPMTVEAEGEAGLRAGLSQVTA